MYKHNTQNAWHLGILATNPKLLSNNCCFTVKACKNKAIWANGHTSPCPTKHLCVHMHMYLSTSMSYTHFPHGRGMECQSTRLSVPAHWQPISSPWSPFWNNNQPPYWITSLSPNPAVYPSSRSKKKKKRPNLSSIWAWFAPLLINPHSLTQPLQITIL